MFIINSFCDIVHYANMYCHENNGIILYTILNDINEFGKVTYNSWCM